MSVSVVSCLGCCPDRRSPVGMVPAPWRSPIDLVGRDRQRNLLQFSYIS
ncbi:MAG: hypothetical protein AB4352_09585 [Hormoscilla sp.]